MGEGLSGLPDRAIISAGTGGGRDQARLSLGARNIQPREGDRGHTATPGIPDRSHQTTSKVETGSNQVTFGFQNEPDPLSKGKNEKEEALRKWKEDLAKQIWVFHCE